MPGAPHYNWFGALPADERKRVEITHEILARRRAQIAKGYDAAHDDEHRAGEIISDPAWGARARLASPDRAALVDAATMIVAEIERLDRAADPSP